MSKKKASPKPLDDEIAALVNWLNALSIRVFLADACAARKYTRTAHLLCELDHIKTTEATRRMKKAKELAQDVIEMSYEADDSGSRYINEAQLKKNIISAFTSPDKGE